MDNLWLANYLEENVIADMNATGRMVRNRSSLSGHWLSRLRTGEKLGTHEWHNLTALIRCASQLLGKNYQPALFYCEQHSAGNRLL